MSTTTRQIIELLHQRHPSPEWAAFPELRMGTGFTTQQAMDFYALNLYPSKRNAAVAYEIKTSRSDFLRELQQPAKRVAAEQLSNETWFVGPPQVFKEAELPEKWGLLVVQADGTLKRVRAAAWRDIQAFPLHFTLALARRSVADEKPLLPPGAWKRHGQEIDDAALEFLIQETIATRRAEKAEEHARKRVREWITSDRYTRDLALLEEVKHACQLYTGDGVEKFREWVELQKQGISPDLKYRMECVQDAVHALMGGKK